MYLDLHLHLVPGVDDGAEDLEESLAMARALVARGWEGGAVTPHLRPGLFENHPAGLREATGRLVADLAEAGVPFAVHPGAEHYLVPEILELVLTGEGVPLGGSGNFVLVEAPTSAPLPGLADVVFRMRMKGLVPVFAHPERCAVFKDLANARQVVAAGAVLQLDLGSIGGAYGSPARKTAQKLLAEDLYAVAGTDLHGLEQAEGVLDGWLKALTKAAGSARRERLLDEGPRRLLSGATP